jgi:hypothetical protein
MDSNFTYAEEEASVIEKIDVAYKSGEGQNSQF